MGLREVAALIVNVRLFAAHKERAGRGDVRLCLPDGARVSDALRETLRLHPAIARDAAGLVAAVNEEYQLHDFALSDGDELAIIPPVSGGAAPQ